ANARATKDPSHKKGKKVLIDYCQNILKYNLNPTKLNYAIKYLEENAPTSDVLKEFKDKVNTDAFKAERAEYILSAGFIDLEEAVNYLKEKDGNNPLLKEFNVDNIEAFKEERARDMAENRAKYRVNGRYNPHIHAADDYWDSLPHRVVEKPVERVVESAEETVKNEEKKHALKGVFTMNFDNIKNCSIAQAMQVVQYAFKYDNETIEEAFAKIRTLAPMEADMDKKAEMEKLIKLAGMDFEELRKKQAKELKASLKDGNTVDAELLDRADSYLASVDTYEGPDDIKDSATAEKNYDALKAELDALEEVDANGNPKWVAIVKEYTDKFAFTDKDGKEADEAERKKAIETLWRATKTNILVSHTLDWEWMKKFNAKDTDKAILVRDEVEDFYGFTLAKAYDAKSIRSPKGKELDVGSDEYLNYMKEVTDKSAKSLKRLLSDSKSKLKVGIDTVVAAAAHAYSEIDSMAQHLDIKGFKSKFVNKVKKYRNEFDDWMEANHHKSWKRAKTIAAGFKANKVQIISNTVATIAYTGATVASIATANPALWAGASKVYAGYIAGGSAIFPFFNKRHIEREQARQRGEDVAKWTGFKGLQNAVKSTFSSGRETLSWSAKVGFGFAAAYVTCAIADSTVANMCVQKSAEKTAEFVLASRGARLMSSLVRSAASVAAQVTTWATDGIKYAFKPNEINKAYYEQSKQGLKWGAIIAGCGAAFQILSYEILGARGSSANNHVEENAVQHDEKPTGKTANNVVNKAVKSGVEAKGTKGSGNVLQPEETT
ncbi:MAG: hypothetical protein II830_04235, partial [Alphaproteobacteria bacterium]|nr:hypothetical protein [Alphaproteobacteria bacterium]